ncbi:TIGR01244 family phosphatase [Allosphingosinicella flava]|uniref:TIGR01244 family phosphatase n=1 Tax=Allosphingosinicella flava TaxID=2771430 RepID=A0A7T2GIG1_9SPHN|nr:TIGR01244 family sulfur transferase [Sphingosinicella flava]QPQ54496.1 TIGR01244 family phosphatase [Sphingosinicella flava]
MRKIDECLFVAGQIRPEDMPAFAAQGMRMIVNNRPDDEELGQPSHAEIEAAAAAAGIACRHIPVAGGFSADQVAAMGEALGAANGPVLAFCRSGTRSTFLWALTRAQAGEEAVEIMRKAAEAGYDLTPIAPYLTRAG